MYSPGTVEKGGLILDVFFTVPTEVPLRIVRYLPKVQKIARKKNFTQ
jgi:hypothetical protein